MQPHLIPLVAGFVACSSAMVTALKLARLYAPQRDPLVISGPTGSGKSHLARLVHDWSGRRGPLIEIAAPELQEALGYSQLFGHEKWAFTDARTREIGLIAEAAGGTLFLDEADGLEPGFQAMLLRSFDTGRVRPLGSSREFVMGARVIIGTKSRLDVLVKSGAWRPDLRYRIGFFEVPLPPLSQRHEDIAPLATHFLAQRAAEDGLGPLGLSPEALASLEMAPWEGNVRELRGALRLADCMARAEGDHLIRVAHLPAHLRFRPSFDRRMDRAAKERLVSWVLWTTNGNVSAAARIIGADRGTVAAIQRDLVSGRRRDDVLGEAAEPPQSGCVASIAR